MKVIKEPKILPSACLHCSAVVQLKWKDLRPMRNKDGKRKKHGAKEIAVCPLCKGPIFPQFERRADDERN